MHDDQWSDLIIIMLLLPWSLLPWSLLTQVLVAVHDTAYVQIWLQHKHREDCSGTNCYLIQFKLVIH